jgi:hypothetical protein
LAEANFKRASGALHAQRWRNSDLQWLSQELKAADTFWNHLPENLCAASQKEREREREKLELQQFNLITSRHCFQT